MSEAKNPRTNSQRKETTMTESKRPDWIKNAPRVDRPNIEHWYRPEDGAVDGTLIWRGRQEHAPTGDTYNAYAIREAATGRILGVSERAGLRDLRAVRVGSRLYFNPTEVKELDNGRKFQQFEIFAEGLEPLSETTRGNGKGGGFDGAPPTSETAHF